MKTPKKPTPEQDAIAFMRSMLALVERRGLRYVDEEFGRAMMALAILIVGTSCPASTPKPSVLSSISIFNQRGCCRSSWGIPRIHPSVRWR
jgi:hypothetical protein